MLPLQVSHLTLCQSNCWAHRRTWGRGTEEKGKGNIQGWSNWLVKTVFGADSWQTLPSTCFRALFLTGSLHILPIFVTVYCQRAPRARLGANFSLDGWQQPDNQNKNKTQWHSVLLKRGPSSSSAEHRSALKPHFIYLYTLPCSLFLATGAHDIVAWDTLEQGSRSPCKWWQQLPPGSSVY